MITRISASFRTAAILPAGVAVLLLCFATAALPATWTIETLDSAGTVGFCTAIASDLSGHLHISYLDRTNDLLKYATNASGTWVIETVESVYTLGSMTTSIAVDPAGHAHISYWDGWNDRLKYATNASGAWLTETVGGSGTGWYSDIAVDGAGHAHISTYAFWSGALRYVTNASGTWTSVTVDTAGDVGSDNAIALDPLGHVHISYYDYTNQDLKYATNASGSWVAETVESYGSSGTATSIAVDSDFRVHISYRCHPGILRYAVKIGASWVFMDVNGNSVSPDYTSLALDSMGRPHIAYDAGGEVDYAELTSGLWNHEVVEDGAYFPSLAITPSGGLAVSFCDTTDFDLKCATAPASSLPLELDKTMLSASAGGTVQFFLEAGSPNAGRNYLLLGSVTGTAPGTPLPGGAATLPLNWDLFTNLVLALVNTPVFQNFMGPLDGTGAATAQMNLGPVPGGAGVVLYFAYALSAPWDFASNPVGITLAP